MVLMLVCIYNLLSALDLSACPEEQILNQPDMDDCVGCENQDDEVEAMIEELPSGSEKFSMNYILLLVVL